MEKGNSAEKTLLTTIFGRESSIDSVAIKGELKESFHEDVNYLFFNNDNYRIKKNKLVALEDKDSISLNDIKKHLYQLASTEMDNDLSTFAKTKTYFNKVKEVFTENLRFFTENAINSTEVSISNNIAKWDMKIKQNQLQQFSETIQLYNVQHLQKLDSKLTNKLDGEKFMRISSAYLSKASELVTTHSTGISKMETMKKIMDNIKSDQLFIDDSNFHHPNGNGKNGDSIKNGIDTSTENLAKLDAGKSLLKCYMKFTLNKSLENDKAISSKGGWIEL